MARLNGMPLLGICMTNNGMKVVTFLAESTFFVSSFCDLSYAYMLQFVGSNSFSGVCHQVSTCQFVAFKILPLTEGRYRQHNYDTIIEKTTVNCTKYAIVLFIYLFRR